MFLALNGACVSALAQVERPHHGGSTMVMASQYPTWKNAAGIYLADNNFASVVIGRGKVSDILEIGNFNFKIPEDAIIEGVTVTIYKGATGKGISDNMVSLVYNGSVCGANYADGKEWAQTTEQVIYGSDSDNWNAGLSPTDINSYSFGVALSVSNSLFSIDSLQANIDYVSISVKYKTPGEPGYAQAKEQDRKAVIYPNPTGNKLTVQFHSIGVESMFMVMDERGRVVRSETVPAAVKDTNSTYTEDVSGLSHGLYSVLINNGRDNYFNRFIKN